MDTEHDLSLAVHVESFLDHLYVQVMTIGDPHPTTDIIHEKVTKAAEESEWDFSAFLTMYPNICPKQATKLRTYVALQGCL